jgi:hypothetical protein
MARDTVHIVESEITNFNKHADTIKQRKCILTWLDSYTCFHDIVQYFGVRNGQASLGVDKTRFKRHPHSQRR